MVASGEGGALGGSLGAGNQGIQTIMYRNTLWGCAVLCCMWSIGSVLRWLWMEYNLSSCESPCGTPVTCNIVLPVCSDLKKKSCAECIQGNTEIFLSSMCGGESALGQLRADRRWNESRAEATSMVQARLRIPEAPQRQWGWGLGKEWI